MLRPLIPALLLAGVMLPAQAEQAERYEVQGSEVTLFLHPFLSEEETMTLRIIGQSPDALSVFLPEGGQFAALAVAPEEGFIRDGMPVESAVAIGNLPDMDDARSAALDGCNEARSSEVACEIVLEISPR